MSIRSVTASFGFGIIGTVINGAGLFALNALLEVYPQRNISIFLPIGLSVSFLVYFVAY